MTDSPLLILIRPELQSRQLLAGLRGSLGDVATLVAPVMEIVAHADGGDLPVGAGVILTSANAVRHAPPLAGRKAWCVGRRTADAAWSRGAQVVLSAPDAEALVAAVLADPPGIALWHLAGKHRRGKIAERLESAGTETHIRVVYAQAALPVSAELKAAVEGERKAVLPLYSPRSARLLGRAVHRPGLGLHVIAMSPAVARSWAAETGGAAEICTSPDGAEMRGRIVAAMAPGSP